MSRVTRPHTVAGHLVAGGFTRLALTEEEQAQGPSRPEGGFAVRNHIAEDGTLLTAVGAYGPDWSMTLAQIRFRLEEPYIRYSTVVDVPQLGSHEALVRWATAGELQARQNARKRQQAPVAGMLRRQEAESRALAERQELESAGQAALF